MKNRGREIYELVKTFEFDPVELDNDYLERLHFRVEIFRSVYGGGYFPRVHRIETYHIAPSFQECENSEDKESLEKFDEVLIVRDDHNEWEKLTGASVEDTLNKVIARMNEFIGGKKIRTL